jgi:hypothetical protein
MLVCHTCDNRACINPDHLWLGTQSANLRDMVDKKRRKYASGEAHRSAKLNARQASVIRKAAALGVSQGFLATCFGIRYQSVQKIICNRSWKMA